MRIYSNKQNSVQQIAIYIVPCQETPQVLERELTMDASDVNAVAQNAKMKDIKAQRDEGTPMSTPAIDDELNLCVSQAVFGRE